MAEVNLENVSERILTQDKKRFVLFPIFYHEVSVVKFVSHQCSGNLVLLDMETIQEG